MSPEQSRSAHELSGAGLYESLPRSLKEPCAVRSRQEDPDLQRERAELTRSKTPSQLAAFHGLRDIPIPGTSETRARSKANAEDEPEPSEQDRLEAERQRQENRFNTLPTPLVRPCVVRSRVSCKRFNFSSVHMRTLFSSYLEIKKTTHKCNSHKYVY